MLFKHIYVICVCIFVCVWLSWLPDKRFSFNFFATLLLHYKSTSSSPGQHPTLISTLHFHTLPDGILIYDKSNNIARNNAPASSDFNATGAGVAGSADSGDEMGEFFPSSCDFDSVESLVTAIRYAYKFVV